MQGWKSREIIESNTSQAKDEEENLREKNHAEPRCDDFCLNASAMTETGCFCAPTYSLQHFQEHSPGSGEVILAGTDSADHQQFPANTRHGLFGIE